MIKKLWDWLTGMRTYKVNGCRIRLGKDNNATITVNGERYVVKGNKLNRDNINNK